MKICITRKTKDLGQEVFLPFWMNLLMILIPEKRRKKDRNRLSCMVFVFAFNS